MIHPNHQDFGPLFAHLSDPHPPESDDAPRPSSSGASAEDGIPRNTAPPDLHPPARDDAPARAPESPSEAAATTEPAPHATEPCERAQAREAAEGGRGGWG